MADSRNDDELLRASATDAEAFAAFYRRHAEAILLYLRSRTGDMEAAADLTADVFAAAFASRRRYRPREEPARAWLFGIANNLLAMRRRTQRRSIAARKRLGLPRIEFHDEDLDRAETLVSIALRGDVATALVDDLPSVQRDAVIARIIDEREYGDIAREQGCKEETVRQRVRRGLARVGLSMPKEEI